MPVLGVELTVDKLVVVLRNLAHLRNLQQVVALIHLDAERVERAHHLLHVSDDGLLAVRQLGQVVPLDLAVERQLHLLGVDHHKLQLRRMFLVEQRRDDGIQAHRLTRTRGTCHQQVGHLGQVGHKGLVRDGLAQRHRQRHLAAVAESVALQHGLHRHHLRLGVGNLDTHRALAGDGGDDADAQRRQRQGDIVLQRLNFRDAHAWRRLDFIERDRRSRRSGNLDNLDAVVAQRRNDAILVGHQLLAGHLHILFLPVLQHIGAGHLEIAQLPMRVIQRVERPVARFLLRLGLRLHGGRVAHRIVHNLERHLVRMDRCNRLTIRRLHGQHLRFRRLRRLRRRLRLALHLFHQSDKLIVQPKGLVVFRVEIHRRVVFLRDRLWLHLSDILKRVRVVESEIVDDGRLQIGCRLFLLVLLHRLRPLGTRRYQLRQIGHLEMHLVDKNQKHDGQEQQQHQRSPTEQMVQCFGKDNANTGTVLKHLVVFHPHAGDVAQHCGEPYHPEQGGPHRALPRQQVASPQAYAVEEQQKQQADRADAKE